MVDADRSGWRRLMPNGEGAQRETPAGGLRSLAVRGMMWVGGDQIGRRVIDQIFAIILARLLAPKDFGLLALAAVFTSFLRIFGNMGLGASIVQRREVDDEYLSTAFWANLTAGLILTGIAAAVGALVGRWVNEPVVGVVLVVLSLRFVITAGGGTQLAIISRRMDYRVLALRSVVATIVGGVIGITMAYRGLGVWSLVGQELGMVTSGTILLYRATGWRPRFVFSRTKFRDLWSFGGKLQLSSLFTYMVRNIDNLLVGRYLGATALGFYAFGYTVFLAPLNDLGLLNRVMFSALSRIQDDETRMKRGFLRATEYATMIVLPMMVGLSLVAPLVVEVLFGAKWLPSVPIIRLLSLAGFFQLIMTFGPITLQAAGRPDLRLQLAVLSALLYLPAFVVGLQWGIVGVAAGYLVATLVMFPILYRFVSRLMGLTFREMRRAVSASVVACTAMAAVVAPAMWALGGIAGVPKIVLLAALVTLGAVVYAGITWAIQRQAVLGLLRTIREAAPRSRGPRSRPAEEV